MSTLNPITAAAMPDPVSLAIEAHRAAWVALAQDLAEEDATSGEDGMSPTPVAAWEAAGRAEEEAWNAILATRPADADGLARLIRYIADIPRIQVLDDARDLVRNLAEAAEAARQPIAAAEPDPIFALIETHRTAYAAWSPLANAWSETAAGSPEWDAAEAAQAEPGARETAAFDALLKARPTTAAGLWALTAYLPEAVRKVGLSTDSTEQAALDALREGAMRLGLAQASAPPMPGPAHPDAALLALGLPFLAAWRDEGAADPVPDGEHSEAEAWCSALADRIADLPAATPEGLGIKALAFACYSGGIGSPAEPMPEPHASSTASDDALLWQIQAGAARILAGETGAAAPSADDAAALALVDAIEREWAAFIGLEQQGRDDDSAEANARHAAAMDRRSALLDAAEALPGRSRDARHAKALALAWIIAVDLWTEEQPREQYGTDGRLALDLMDSLAGGIPPATADASRAAAAPPALDLSGCSIPQLARLYEMFQAAYDHLSALSELPCFQADNSASNPAGEIIDREADRLAAMFDTCVREIERRSPASRSERDDTLSTRVTHELRCNGRIHDPALMRDLVQAWGENGPIVTEAGRR